MPISVLRGFELVVCKQLTLLPRRMWTDSSPLAWESGGCVGPHGACSVPHALQNWLLSSHRRTASWRSSPSPVGWLLSPQFLR